MARRGGILEQRLGPLLPEPDADSPVATKIEFAVVSTLQLGCMATEGVWHNPDIETDVEDVIQGVSDYWPDLDVVAQRENITEKMRQVLSAYGVM